MAAPDTTIETPVSLIDIEEGVCLTVWCRPDGYIDLGMPIGDSQGIDYHLSLAQATEIAEGLLGAVSAAMRS